MYMFRGFLTVIMYITHQYWSNISLENNDNLKKINSAKTLRKYSFAKFFFPVIPSSLFRLVHSSNYATNISCAFFNLLKTSLHFEFVCYKVCRDICHILQYSILYYSRSLCVTILSTPKILQFLVTGIKVYYFKSNKWASTSWARY